MRLDYQPKSGFFVLHVPRGDADIGELMRDHGLDYSTPASTLQEACLFTREPFAACAFGHWATPPAFEQLATPLAEISASWALEPSGSSWPDYLKAKAAPDPYPLQLADLEYIQRRQHALDADEPGIGKTATAIMWGNLLAWEHRRPERFRGLVICPASIRQQWAERIREWSSIPRVAVSVLTVSSRGVPGTDVPIHWHVVSYDMARSKGLYDALLKNNYDLMVIDEAHYLKSPVAGRTRAIFGAADRTHSIADRAAHVLALSGTPIPNRPREAYTLAKYLCFEAVDFLSERAFNERFNPRQPRKNAGGRVTGVIERVGRYHELQARLRSSFMTRHLFADAFPQLKLPVYDLVYADLDAADGAPIRAALEKEKLLDFDPETFKGADSGFQGGMISTVRLEMGVALAPQAARYVKMLHASGWDKITVFAWHKEVMDILQSALDKIGVVRVDGSTTEKQKQQAVLAFQTDPKIGVILGNVLSLGTGTDGLQKVCHRAFIAEPDWVNGNNIQCIQRLHRGGQASQVYADIMVASGSLAEYILAASLRKGRIVHSALDARVGG